MTEEALRGHDHHRPGRSTEGLPPEQVEVLGRRRRVGDPHVVLGAELEKPLQSGRRVLRTLSLVPMGE